MIVRRHKQENVIGMGQPRRCVLLAGAAVFCSTCLLLYMATNQLPLASSHAALQQREPLPAPTFDWSLNRSITRERAAELRAVREDDNAARRFGRCFELAAPEFKCKV